MKPLLLSLLVAFNLASSPALAAPIDVSFPTLQNITLTAKLFLPAASNTLAPAVVLMHGCSGIFSYSDSSKGLALLFREWGERLSDAGYAALVVDSFSGRNVAQDQCGNGDEGVSEVSDRPYDALGAVQFLKNSYSGWIDQGKVALLGWSHGASSTISTMSTEMSAEHGASFRAAFAMYPGCGLYNAFGGISRSTYVPYAPLHILHGGIDPLYTGGFCDTRIANATTLGSSNMDMTVYPGAQHGFDNARKVDSKWTQSDADAKVAADAFVMRALGKLFK